MQIKKTLRIVSRKSRLALAQAEIVATQLRRFHPGLQIEIIGITTVGDEILNTPLNKIGGKGLFVKELENCLLEQRADIAVHSMKDVPAELPPGLQLGAILAREDPRDVICTTGNYDIASLPPGSVIGSSSLRRQAQILAVRKDLKVATLRGNVETRIKKMVNGEYGAIILAAAGLTRLGLSQWLQHPLATTQMLPAVGQGALGIEYRSDALEIAELISPLNNLASATCVLAERTMNKILDGGCQAPVAGYATIQNDLLTLHGLVSAPDGSIIYRAQHHGKPEEAARIGQEVAQQLIKQGAARIISDLKCSGQL
jgi:hydroxymethylbilane synthase